MLDLSARVQMYPNPAFDHFSLSCNLTEAASVNIVVRNLAGKELLTRDFGQRSAGTFREELSVADLPSGVYLLEIVAGEQRANLRFAVQ